MAGAEDEQEGAAQPSANGRRILHGILYRLRRAGAYRARDM